MRPPERLTYQEIENRALALLLEYGKGKLPPTPIPIQQIMENHLGLTLLFGDPLEHGLGPSTLGAIYFDDNLVFINKTLSDNDTLEGRLNFTCGHETGHDRMHRGVVDPMDYIRPILKQARKGSHVICRAGDNSPLETQADIYSACVLMPRQLVTDAVHQVAAHQRIWRENNCYIYSAGEERSFIGTLADWFRVSRQSMRLRLNKLGLAVQGNPGQLRLF